MALGAMPVVISPLKFPFTALILTLTEAKVEIPG